MLVLLKPTRRKLRCPSKLSPTGYAAGTVCSCNRPVWILEQDCTQADTKKYPVRALGAFSLTLRIIPSDCAILAWRELGAPTAARYSARECSDDSNDSVQCCWPHCSCMSRASLRPRRHN